jgi:hypothetical protein
MHPDRVQEAFRGRRYPFDIDVLAGLTAHEVAKAEQERGTARTASAKHYWNPRAAVRRSIKSGEHASLE